MTLAQALAAAAALGLARLDAQLLLLHALGRPGAERAWLLAHDGDALAPAEQDHFLALVRRRAAGEPVAYLLGAREFFGLPLAVDARVLVPRPETEVLVEWALDRLDGHTAPRVLDLGTGSGAVALAIAHRRRDAQVTAVDTSADALAVARANAAALGLPITLLHGDWFDALGSPARPAWDVIVSNPPYVAEGDPHLPALAHEPTLALTSGPDGLDAIRRIAAKAPAWLRPGGWLLLEHGHDQAAAVAALLRAAGLGAIGHRNDLAGIARCTGGQRPPVE